MNRPMLLASAIALLALPEFFALQAAHAHPNLNSGLEAQGSSGGHGPPPPPPPPPPPENPPPPPPPPHRPGEGKPSNFHPVNGSRFVYPRGYHARRWTIGRALPRVLRGPAYSYSYYAGMGLSEPAPGYGYFRYGPDLLMANLRTGRIGDVIPGAFTGG